MTRRLHITLKLLLCSGLLSACGTLELGIENTVTPAVIPPESTAVLVETLATPVSSPPDPTRDPPTPTLIPDPGQGQVYTNSFYHISLTHPASWTLVPGYSTIGDKFEGEDGYFIVDAASGGALDDVVQSQVEHRLAPFGSDPLVTPGQIAGQEARFIWPSADASMADQAALIVTFPLPVTISGSTYEHLILYADGDHLPDLAQSLQFISESDIDFWVAADIPRDTLVPLLLRQRERATPFGDIATIRADGKALNQLTTYRFNVDPVLSPDGRRIAYRSIPITITSLPDPGTRLYEGNYNIWVITMDGETAWQLTQSEEMRSLPTWSADSQRVAFSQGADGQLIEVEVNSQDSRLVTADAFNPRYRPDGSGISFFTGSGDLAWIDGGGTIHTVLSATDLADKTSISDFDWFADGQHILYTLANDSEKEDENLPFGTKFSVWIASADGASHSWLADDLHDASISPDGRIVAGFVGSGFGDACIVDRQIAFWRLSAERTSVEEIAVEDLAGLPQTGPGESFYPLSRISWVAGHVAQVEFSLTCSVDQSPAGWYLIDPLRQRMIQILEG